MACNEMLLKLIIWLIINDDILVDLDNVHVEVKLQ